MPVRDRDEIEFVKPLYRTGGEAFAANFFPNMSIVHKSKTFNTVTMTSKSEVTIRCFQPEDGGRCRTLFTEGIRGLYIAVMKTSYLLFLKVTTILLVLVTAFAVKWSIIWTSLVVYLVAMVVMTAGFYVFVYLHLMYFINSCLNTDLLDIEKYYDGHDSCMFVAECDGRVIGMVGVATKEHHKPGVAELQRMSVCSSARGKGIGTMLVNKVIEYCKERKNDKIVLTTSTAQPAALALYRKNGFKFVSAQQYPHYLLSNLYFFYFEKNI